MERLIDLENRHLRLLRELLGTYLTDKTVWAYGSRVKWKADPASDLDLVVWNATDMEVANAKEAFVESNLPFTVQLLVWEDIPEDFKDNIRKKYVVLQEKTELAGWREVRLGEVVTFHYGKSLTQQNRISGEVPIFSSAGTVGFHNEALVDSQGIIVGRKGTVGKVYYSKTPFYCIDTAYYILPSDEYSLKFLFFLLQTLGLNELNEDSAVPGLNRDTAYQQKILLPALPEQKAIAEVLSSLDDKIDLLHRQNKTLENLAQTLFRQWFVEEADSIPKNLCLNSI